MFDRWFNGSKYMQVVFSGDPTYQAAKDGWRAGVEHALSQVALANGDGFEAERRVKKMLEEFK